jgi:glutathione S-transferase
MLLNELCVKDIEIVTLTNLEDLSHDLIRSFNPFCKVPILVFMDESQIAMTECGAILTYILEQYDTSYLLHPNPAEGPEGYAHYSQLFFFALSTVYPLLSIRIVEAQLEFGEGAGVLKAVDEWQDIVGPKLELHLEEKVGKFLYGDELSPVDMVSNTCGESEECKTSDVVGFEIGRIKCGAEVELCYVKRYLERYRNKHTWNTVSNTCDVSAERKTESAVDIEIKQINCDAKEDMCYSIGDNNVSVATRKHTWNTVSNTCDVNA